MKKVDEKAVEVESVFPKRRQEKFAEDSWGYKNSYFEYVAKEKALFLRGKKYPQIVNQPFRHTRDFLKNSWFVDITELEGVPSNSKISPEDYKAVENAEFFTEIQASKIDFSIDVEDRFFRCHSQAPRDFYVLKFMKYKRIPDIVIWPKCHKDVELIVKAANKHNVAIIPVGGLTNVTCANNCPENETRMIVSLDMTQMNRMLWLNESSMLACFETGIVGQDLERTLEERGYIMGHEPDSVEFSTLGGWIATRSSGIKQQAYGNIEDIVLSTKTVTSIGVLDKSFIAPRVAMGPELDACILGSEGTLGVVTEAIVRIHNLPKVRRFGGIVFPTLSAGISCLHECSRCDWLPSSLRLLDNIHAKYGSAFRVNDSLFGEIYDRVAQIVLTNRFMLGYEENSYAIATYLIEGDNKSVNEKEAKFLAVAKKHGGFKAGEKYGKRGYFMTLTVAYSRDMLFRLGLLADSLETSCGWEKCEDCIKKVEAVYNQHLMKLKVQGFIAFRVSQVYHSGVCIYLYFGVARCEDQLKVFDDIVMVVKKAVISCGASLSHHHGIGKKNSIMYNKVTSNVGKEMMRSLKEKIDPKNVFAAGNLIYQQNLSSKL